MRDPRSNVEERALERRGARADGVFGVVMCVYVWSSKRACCFVLLRV
jgi:hypothetical protein